MLLIFKIYVRRESVTFTHWTLPIGELFLQFTDRLHIITVILKNGRTQICPPYPWLPPTCP